MFRTSTLTNAYEHWERNNHNNNNNNGCHNGHVSDYLLNNSSARHRISVRPRKTHIPIAVRRSVLNNATDHGPTTSSSSTVDRMSKITHQFSNQIAINRSKNTENSHFINTITTSPLEHNTNTQTYTDHNRMYVQTHCHYNNNK